MLIIRGLADSFIDGCKIQKAARQANYSPYYKKSATVGVNYSLTITLSMVLKEAASLSGDNLCDFGLKLYQRKYEKYPAIVVTTANTIANTNPFLLPVSFVSALYPSYIMMK